MADVKEVKITKDGQWVTPVVLADSVYNLDGTNFKDSVYKKSETYSKNEVYSKSEIDNKFKNYTLSTDIMNQSNYMTLNLEVGDSAYISGSYDMPPNYTFDIRSQVSGGVFFVAMIDGADNKSYIREDVAGNYIVRLKNSSSSTWGDTARIYIRRLK